MFPSTSTDILYPDPIQRKWSPPSMNQPEPLKIFLQHRIKSIIAKEWWDFVVNVNNMNSDHASLLYSVANLCPSFQVFLKSRDKEINYILKKRPAIKPRIFSGSERLDVPSESLPPPKDTSPPKKSCSAELEKILNELYPNDKSIIKRNSKLSGPASKQRKTPNKTFQSAQNKKDAKPSGPTVDAKIINSTVSPGCSSFAKVNGVTSSQEFLENNTITLSNLLRENNSSVTAFSTIKPTTTTSKMYGHSKNSNSVSKENESKKVEYAVSDFDVNRNNLGNKIKIKKINRVKRKRYYYTDKFSRVRTCLEDETPELKLEWIKKYKLKKWSINLKRLSDSEIAEAMQPKPKSMPAVCDTLENKKQSEKSSSSPSLPTIEETSAPSAVSLAKTTSTEEIVSTNLPTTLSVAKPTNLSTTFSDVKPSISPTLSEVKPSNLPTTREVKSSLPIQLSEIKPSNLSKTLAEVKPSCLSTALSECKSPSSPTTLSDAKSSGPTADAKNSIVSPGCSSFAKVIEVTSVNSESISSISEKFSENANLTVSVKYRSNQKENVDIGEKLKPKELNNDLKTVYYHGGIVPLGKKVISDKTLEKNKHFLSLKEKKIKDSSSDSNDSISPLKEKNVQNINVETKPELAVTLNIIKCTEKNNELLVLTAENSSQDNKLEANVTSDNTITSKDSDSVMPNHVNGADLIRKNFEICQSNVSNAVEDEEENALIIDESNENEESITGDDIGCNLTKVSSCNLESSIPVIKEKKGFEESSSDNGVVLDSLEEMNLGSTITGSDKNQVDIPTTIKEEQIFLENSPLSTITCVEDKNPNNSFENYSKTGLKVTESPNAEPPSKRPRIEVNLAEMKINITKTLSEGESIQDTIHCRLCKETFKSQVDWHSHFHNNVPKCTPNLKVTWDRSEVRLLN